jgi:Caspase domain
VSRLCTLFIQLALATALLAGAAPARAEQRLAVIVGNNRGGSKPALRYAERDARQVARVLRDLGGVDQVHLLLGRSSADLRRLLDSVHRRAAQRPDRTVLFFFYSGHADEQALLMDRDRLAFTELRRRLKAVPARVTVAFIDACQSGQLARSKGGRSVSTVNVSFAGDRASRGQVFISSSAGDETSQESDALRASYFTHYLVSALRGAADDSGDGRVSLQEAYRFVYRNTVERTSRTLAGVQHPTYDVKLSGRGQLVLTELSKSASAIILARAATGTFQLYDSPRQNLVAEVKKQAGKQVRIALRPGRYEVRRRAGAVQTIRVLALAARREVVVDGRQMVHLTTEPARGKGGGDARSIALGLRYDLHSGYLDQAGLLHGGQVAVGAGWSSLRIGGVLGYAGSRYDRQDQIAVTTHELNAAGALEWLPWRLGPATLRVAVELGLGWLHQTGEIGGREPQVRTSLFGFYRGGLGLEVTLMPGVWLMLQGFAGQVVLERADGWQAPLVGGANLGLGYAL